MTLRIMALLVALVVGGTGFVFAAEETIIQEASANGMRSLRPFTVQDNWEIQWESKGQRLTITVRDKEGNLLQPAASQTGPGSGSTYMPKGGTFYLEVMGMGDWVVNVVHEL